ncbi:3'(2'),5'-bisphosphate nucleotidase CysQ [Palleronia sp.]|uniref:3'(2'),5'-bisphosphate nucleotidase CysQ n=1 Tax=Palleronia sp. TaxID=1940284 RepID=UPI0035C79A8B
MPATDLPLLIDAARTAGDIAVRHWQGAPQTWMKDDASPVSAADIEVDTALRDALLQARPDYGWLSEESPEDPTRLEREECFILDPIDGTRAFLRGEETWAISLAVVSGGEPTAAVVHLPARGLTYTATREGAWLNGDPVRVSARPDPDGARVLANKASFATEHWRRLPQFQRSFRPSVAYRLACLAQGRTDLMLSLRPAWEWDIAAGALIAASAGARVTDRQGRALSFNSPQRASDGIVAANPTLHAKVRDALA